MIACLYHNAVMIRCLCVFACVHVCVCERAVLCVYTYRITHKKAGYVNDVFQRWRQNTLRIGRALLTVLTLFQRNLIRNENRKNLHNATMRNYALLSMRLSIRMDADTRTKTQRTLVQVDFKYFHFIHHEQHHLQFLWKISIKTDCNCYCKATNTLAVLVYLVRSKGFATILHPFP